MLAFDQVIDTYTFPQDDTFEIEKQLDILFQCKQYYQNIISKKDQEDVIETLYNHPDKDGVRLNYPLKMLIEKSRKGNQMIIPILRNFDWLETLTVFTFQKLECFIEYYVFNPGESIYQNQTENVGKYVIYKQLETIESSFDRNVFKVEIPLCFNPFVSFRLVIQFPENHIVTKEDEQIQVVGTGIYFQMKQRKSMQLYFGLNNQYFKLR